MPLKMNSRIFLTICLLLDTTGVLGFYFSQANYNIRITSELPVGATVTKIYVMGDLHSREEISCSIISSLDSFAADNVSPRSYFSFHQQNYSIYLSHQLPDLDQELHFVLKCQTSATETLTKSANVTIRVNSPSDVKSPGDTDPNICQNEAVIELQVQENLDNASIATLSSVMPSDYGFLGTSGCFTNMSDYFTVDNITAELKLKKPFDREKQTPNPVPLKMTCLVKNKTSDFTHRCNYRIRISILDVDDNPPYLLKDGEKVTQISGFTFPPHLSMLALTKGGGSRVYDDDVAENNVMEAYIVGQDAPDKLTAKIMRRNGQDQIFLKKVNATSFPLFNFDVIVNDTTFRPFPPSDIPSHVTYSFIQEFPQADIMNSDTTTAFTTKKTPRKPDMFHVRKKTLLVKVSSTARNLTQVLVLSTAGNYTNTIFEIQNTVLYDMFRITPKEGIIYVWNSTALRVIQSRTLHVKVTDQNTGIEHEDVVFVKIVNMFGTDVIGHRSTCDLSSCASHSKEDDCVSSCGAGSATEKCSWRKLPSSIHTGAKTSKFETCSHNLTTCPNRVCDELEEMIPSLCPQDCTIKEIIGHASLIKPADNSTVPRGIDEGTGPCSCDKYGQCTCMPPAEIDMSMFKGFRVVMNASWGTNPGASDGVANRFTNIGTEHYKEPGSHRADPHRYGNPCDLRCKLTVAAAFCGVMVVVCLVVVIRCIRIKTNTEKTCKKSMDRSVSLSALPSDYVDQENERSRMSPNASMTSLEWSPHFVFPKIQEDSKWEFPRKNLILDKTLGEGEFGRVVRGEAYGINNSQTYTTVAVKMLKHCASHTEFRDLLSEYNLLKEVDHINVIKLLGACTQKGPIYIIVEYCELGSLKYYLRGMRRIEALYTEGRDITRDPEGTRLSDDVISPSDLMSFSWQIAKGMAYLAQMKVVHRDLATRNILVASGKTIKISDFGLSRDIYEADAYTKKTRGKLPVKWMAPESLYDHIYTTKSDVWSYGVVLWEIVTLGANPYPGVPPERLYNLLKVGYRMEKPPNCSNELFELMERCWKQRMGERPAFKELADIFENMMKKSVDYLDLSMAVERNPIVDDEYQDEYQGKIGQDVGINGLISPIATDRNSYLTPLPRVHFSNGTYDNENNLNKLVQSESENEICENTKLLSETTKSVDETRDCESTGKIIPSRDIGFMINNEKTSYKLKQGDLGQSIV